MFRLAMLRKMNILTLHFRLLTRTVCSILLVKEGLIHRVYDKFIRVRLSQSLIYGGGLNPRVGLTFGFLRYLDTYKIESMTRWTQRARSAEISTAAVP